MAKKTLLSLFFLLTTGMLFAQLAYAFTISVPGTGPTSCVGEVLANCPVDPPSENYDCRNCLCGTPPGSWTSIGCVNTSSLNGVAASIMRIALGIIGGIMLLMLISVGYLYNTGLTENIEAAKKRLTAMFTALLLLVFSALFLRVIGVNVLDVVTVGIIG